MRSRSSLKSAQALAPSASNAALKRRSTAGRRASRHMYMVMKPGVKKLPSL